MNSKKCRGMITWSFIFAGLILVLAAGTVGIAEAAYPDKPITVIVPWPPGGASDVIPRTLAKPMSEFLKQPVVIVNKPGAAAVIGTQEIERSVPDGYTIGTFSFSQALTQYTTPNPPSLANLVPISKVMYSPGTLTVNAGKPWKTLQEFIQYAKANPGKVRNANSGTGASAHIIGEAFDRLTGIKEVHVPFNGFAPAVAAVAGGHVEATCIPVGDVTAMVKGGKLRLLAVAASERHFLYPNVPTMKELGIDLDMGNWVAFVGPKGMPEEMVATIDRAVAMALKTPEVIKAWQDMGNVMAYMDHKTFAVYLKQQDSMIRNLVDSLGLWVAPRK
ncbi:MAG TPA: tripartite tricarboxylate transporter substrate binding protein [Syntrophorhabdales bacterium]|nr:tripartite tricarboxylate transporter substrate binding protein [Syntrophorhabdales bacterium]